MRHFLYVKNLKGDKKRVYARYGFTSDRLRVDHGFGHITEQWTYHEHGLEFTFDADSRLVEKRSIAKEDRRVTYY